MIDEAGNDLPLGTPLAVPSRDEMLARLEAFFASATGHITLAETDGVIVGLAVGQINLPGLFASAPWLQIELLYVKPEARRHGVGRSLLAEQSLFAAAAGAEYIVTQPINGSRSEQRFLSRLGFTAVGSRRTCETALLQRRLEHEGPRRGLESLIARRRAMSERANTPAQGIPLGGDSRLDTSILEDQGFEESSSSRQVRRAELMRRPSSSVTSTR